MKPIHNPNNMYMTEIKRGDTIEIIPDECHKDYIKEHYGKPQKVTRVMIMNGIKYYKLKGIKGYGHESYIRKIEQ